MAAQFQTVFVALIVILTWLANGCSAREYYQRARLYAGLNGTGERSVPFTVVDSPDLEHDRFDNKAMSVCGTGVWLFYEHPFFNTEQSGLTEFIFLKSIKSTDCHNFVHVGGKLSSMRFVGDRWDFRRDSLTLYEKENFQGKDETATFNLGNLALDGKVASLIVTGLNRYTLYSLPNYQGNATCVRPPLFSDYTPAFVYKTTNIRVPTNSVRSFRWMCHAKK